MNYGMWTRTTTVMGGGRELVEAETMALDTFKQAKEDVSTWFHVVGQQDDILARLWARVEAARQARLQAWFAYHTN